ncbi:penicillin-binding protein 2 [Pseudorhodobacter sp.]|uniref:penicillin-binding protein 2 n=1 Tax=Pseudorhodobacter sp. TaxID=1934400 RepID=UPI002AFF22C7|nr:penicillin-binding protein 2 [Pseudorhodobacter sp.]
MRRSARDTDESARKISRRGLLLGGSMAAVVAVLGARMRHMQVDQADEFRLLAEDNRISIRLIPPARGLIHDRNGKIVAGNEQNYRVVISRDDAGNVEDVLNRLSGILPISTEDFDRALKEARRRSPLPIIVSDRLNWEDVSKVAINAPALPGVSPEVGLSRIYPRDFDFAHVVGYVGPVSDNDLARLEEPDPLLQTPKFQIGKIGVETWMEDELRGKAGNRRVEVNAVGRVMRELGRQEGVAGGDIRLTIDADVQNYVQARLGEESAAAVIMDVQNGDILAIVSSPSFDPNLFVRGISHKDYNSLTGNDHRPLANKSVAGAYPPGSTFKMVTALAALEEGLINTSTSVNCPGHYEVGGRKFHCWRRGGHGRVSLDRALAESCDVYFYDIAMKVGIDKIAEMGRRLGLGVRHDIPMSAITDGLMPDKAWKLERYKKDWVLGDTVNASIGQGFVLTSPMQLAVMTARIASGKAVSPRLIHSIGGVAAAEDPGEGLGLDPKMLAAVRQGMYAVSNSQRGTGYSARIDDKALRMAGKSGTSQVRNISAAERARGVISNDDLPWERRDHALFVGFAPFDAPRYAAAVVVEHGGGGSTVAGPIVRDILLRAMSDGLPPLSAYPAAQRNRIDTMHRKLILRDADGKLPESTRA